MSAFAVGKSVIQLETGIYGIKENHSLLEYDALIWIRPTLRYGALLERLLIADLQYQNEDFTTPLSSTNKSALKQTVLGAKYLIYDPFKNQEQRLIFIAGKLIILSIGIINTGGICFAGANFTMKNNPYFFSPYASISPKAMLITQNHLGDGTWVFVTNIIADYIATDYPSYGYVLTLTKGFNDKWSGSLKIRVLK
jgi:hypothetical protein